MGTKLHLIHNLGLKGCKLLAQALFVLFWALHAFKLLTVKNTFKGKDDHITVFGRYSQSKTLVIQLNYKTRPLLHSWININLESPYVCGYLYASPMISFYYKFLNFTWFHIFIVQKIWQVQYCDRFRTSLIVLKIFKTYWTWKRCFTRILARPTASLVLRIFYTDFSEVFCDIIFWRE